MSLTPETRPTDFSWGHQDLDRESCTQATPVGQLLIRHVQSSWETQILRKTGDISGNAVAKTLHFQCRGQGFYPWLGTKIPRGTCHGQNFFFNFFNYERCCGVGNQGKVGLCLERSEKASERTWGLSWGWKSRKQGGKKGRTFIPSEQHIQAQRPKWSKNMVGTESQDHVREREFGMLWALSLQ